MTLADMRSVDEVIQARVDRGRWVVSPSIASKALKWPIARAALALSELHHSDSHRLVLHLSAICDHCHAHNPITSGEEKLAAGRTVLMGCASCGQSYSATQDNTLVEYHIHSAHRKSGDARKETTSDPSTDTRR
jgi:hypothetical protein